MHNDVTMLAVGMALLTFPFVVCGELTPASDVNDDASCSECDEGWDAGNPAQADQTYREVSVARGCNYPCKCTNTELRCKAGVNVVKDGCDCCYMCARQQGDLCDYKDKCDEEKGLYCDFQLDDGQRGICRAKDALPCDVDGRTYKDGEEFKPDCRRLCSCQNGRHACTTLCPQEDTRPSSIYCPNPRLIEIAGHCCREWTCPNLHQEFVPDPSHHGDTDSHNHDGWGSPDEVDDHIDDPSPMGPRECEKETTSWSSCSNTCDMGYSIRVTNDNEDCLPVEQRRLCLIRPCELQDKHLGGKKCRSTWKIKSTHMSYENCKSVAEYQPKFCSTCKRRKCCAPGRTKTIQMEFTCPDGRQITEPFMWIKNCECHKDRRCPLQ